MNAERQAVAFGRRIDRPERAAPERHLAHRRHQYLDEARVGGAALDLRDGELHVLQRDHDRSAQALVMGQPLGRDPVVDGAGEGAGHVFAEHQVDAVDAVADRVICAPALENQGLQCAERGIGAACGVTKIRPRRQWCARRIADAVERIRCRAPPRIRARMGRDMAAARPCRALVGGRRSRWRERRKACSCAVLPSRHRRNNAGAQACRNHMSCPG